MARRSSKFLSAPGSSRPDLRSAADIGRSPDDGRGSGRGRPACGGGRPRLGSSAGTGPHRVGFKLPGPFGHVRSPASPCRTAPLDRLSKAAPARRSQAPVRPPRCPRGGSAVTRSVTREPVTCVEARRHGSGHPVGHSRLPRVEAIPSHRARRGLTRHRDPRTSCPGDPVRPSTSAQAPASHLRPRGSRHRRGGQAASALSGRRPRDAGRSRSARRGPRGHIVSTAPGGSRGTVSSPEERTSVFGRAHRPCPDQGCQRRCARSAGRLPSHPTPAGATPCAQRPALLVPSPEKTPTRGRIRRPSPPCTTERGGIGSVRACRLHGSFVCDGSRTRYLAAHGLASPRPGDRRAGRLRRQ